jgi:putative lipoprotein
MSRGRFGRIPVAGIVLGALLGAGTAHAADPDPWLGPDKALHFTISAATAATGYGTAAILTPDKRYRFLTGASLALAAGVGKEVLDFYGPGDASWKDLTWDVVGTATGLAVAWAINRIVERSRIVANAL